MVSQKHEKASELGGSVSGQKEGKEKNQVNSSQWAKQIGKWNEGRSYSKVYLIAHLLEVEHVDGVLPNLSLDRIHCIT